MNETVTGVFAWPDSVAAGQQVTVHASGPAGVAQLELVRVGAAREVLERREVELRPHGFGPDTDAAGVDWPVVATIPVPAGARSGYHELVLHVAGPDGPAEHVGYVVVRAARPDPAVPLLVLPTSTWNAYNDVAGTNLYTGGVRASFRRPLPPGFLRRPPGDGGRVTVLGEPDPAMNTHVMYLIENALSQWTGSSGWSGWEGPFVAWAERNGVVVHYATSVDLHGRGDVLDGRRMYLSVGHDEYWSWEMRDAVEDFVAAGGNAAFWSGNVAYWQVRFEDGGATMVGYKQRFEDDPAFRDPDPEVRRRTTSIWADTAIGRPETSLTGLSFTRGGYHRIGVRASAGLGGYTVERGDHWSFAGTGLDRGDVLGARSRIVGYECDGCDLAIVAGRVEPTGADGCPPGTVVLATAPASGFTRTTAARPVPDDALSEVEFNAWRALGDVGRAGEIEHGHAVLAVRDGERGAGSVFATGCTEWIWGLVNGDPQVERISRNVLERFTAPG